MKDLNQRNEKLLFNLIKAEGFQTSQQLAQSLNVSDRTVRNSITELSLSLHQRGIELIAARGKGYMLAEKDKPAAKEMLRSCGAYGDSISEDKILSEILCLIEPEDIDQLSERFFVSRTTLENTLKELKKEIEDSGLELKLCRKKNKIWIEGNEHSFRAFIAYHLENVSFKSTAKDFMGYTSYFPYEELNFVISTVNNVLKSQNISVSDSGIIAIATHILISVQRISRKFTFEAPCLTESEIEVCKAEIYSASEICRTVGEHFHLHENEFEEEALAYYIHFRRSFNGKERLRDNLEKDVAPVYLAVIKEALCDIRDTFFLDLTRDDELYVGLAYHLQETIDRKNNKQSINPILEDIRGKFPFVFELAVFLRNKFLQKLGIDFDESETAYLAVHLGAAIEQLKLQNKPQKIKAVLVCSGSSGTSRFLMAKLLSLFGNRIYLGGPYSAFDYLSVCGEKPDLIISTTSTVMEWPTEIPVVFIHQILDANDTKQVAYQIEKIEWNSVCGLAFQNFFSEEFFFPMLNVETSTEAINFMSEALESKGIVESGFRESTFQREKFSTTVLQNGIAMPHPSEFYSKKTTIAVASLCHPVEWCGSKAQIVFMLAVKRGEQQFLKDFYRLMVNLSDSTENVQKFLQIRDFGKLLTFFNGLTAPI